MNRAGLTLVWSSPEKAPRAGLRAVVARRAAAFVRHALAAWRTLADELSRANNAGIGAEELKRHSRRERVHMVKEALARRHQGVNHCC